MCRNGQPSLCVFGFRFWNYFLHYIIEIIFIVFNIYSVDESDLQRDEVAIIKVFVKYIYIYIYMDEFVATD